MEIKIEERNENEISLKNKCGQKKKRKKRKTIERIKKTEKNYKFNVISFSQVFLKIFSLLFTFRHFILQVFAIKKKKKQKNNRNKNHN